jgi:hypothetical protein
LFQFTDKKFRPEIDSTIGGILVIISGIRDKDNSDFEPQCQVVNLGHSILLKYI